MTTHRSLRIAWRFAAPCAVLLASIAFSGGLPVSVVGTAVAQDHGGGHSAEGDDSGGKHRGRGPHGAGAGKGKGRGQADRGSPGQGHSVEDRVFHRPDSAVDDHGHSDHEGGDHEGGDHEGGPGGEEHGEQP